MNPITISGDNYDLGLGPWAPRVWGRAGAIWALPAHNLCRGSLAILQWASTPDDQVLAVPGSIERDQRLRLWLSSHPKVTAWRRP